MGSREVRLWGGISSVMEPRYNDLFRGNFPRVARGVRQGRLRPYWRVRF